MMHNFVRNFFAPRRARGDSWRKIALEIAEATNTTDVRSDRLQAWANGTEQPANPRVINYMFAEALKFVRPQMKNKEDFLLEMRFPDPELDCDDT